MNGGATFTVNSKATLTGTGVFSGAILVASNATLMAGNYGSGATTCAGMTSVAGAAFFYNFGATNSSSNGLIVVNGNASLGGTVNIADAGGFNSGVYTGFRYTGTLTLNGLTVGTVPGGKMMAITTNTPGYVLFDVLNGVLNPTNDQPVAMVNTSPLPLGWVQVPGATSYEIYLGTSFNAVATATTNTSGIYQGQTTALTLNVSSLQPGTTYYWRVDSVAANRTITVGQVLSFTTGAPTVDMTEDTWVAADALGRCLPGLMDCGSPRTNRPIGLFYYLWQHGYNYGSGTNWDITQYLSNNPYANPHDPWASDPIMQTDLTTYWWGQPDMGYYDPGDPWMLRRHIALLAHAGIDVLIFDYSNGVTYDTQLGALCDMIHQMQFEGCEINFKIVFLTHAQSGATSTYLYNTLYGPNKYSDLWYYWQGKPLILGYINGSGSGDIIPGSTVQNFFTWRESWAYVATNQLQDQWQWIDTPTPQDWGYDARFDLPEELPVSCGGWANGNIGKSQSNNQQQDYDNNHLPLQHTSNLGIFFKEQMNYGLKYDPEFLYLTQWNEWIAGSFAAPASCYTHLLADCCPVNGFYFVDEYNEEYSRDLEPMQGGHTDNYYFQMVAQNRLRKGVRPIPAASAPQTINLTAGPNQWNTVSPAYYDPVNDTVWRNYPSAVSQAGSYTNTTGRNDFTMMKVARDSNYFYFLDQCNSNITSFTGTNWMVLFIDADQNHATGWEGYDYAVNLGGIGPGTTTLYQNTTTTNGWVWNVVRSDIAYTVNSNQLMLAVPRTSLGLASDPVSLDFHWADNFQKNDIADFAVDGDSAPDRRFNYRYVTVTNTEVLLFSDDFENGKQSVWGSTWSNGSSWSITTANPYTGTHCVVCTNGGTQSNLIAGVSTAGYGGLRLSFHFKLQNVTNAQSLTIYYQGSNAWVPIRILSRDEYYPASQSWPYDEQQDVWLNYADTRSNTGPDAQFFSTNFAFRIDGSVVTNSSQNVWVDAVTLTGYTQTPATISPTTWQTRDIGNAGNAGGAATNSMSFTLTGPGQDIWNQGDSFRFMYLTITGDGILTARVASQTVADPWSKAGVMIRESADIGARNAFTAITPGNGAAFQCRPVALQPTYNTTYSGYVAPYWVRLHRTGNNFTSYISPNGLAWTPIGSTNIPYFNSTALWGLAVTAHNNNTNSVAVFDNVTLTQTPVITPISNQMLFAGQTLTVSNSTANPDTPPLVLNWSLSNALPGMTINSSSGVLTWRPTLAQSPSSNNITVSVTDSSSLTATQRFAVIVLPPPAPSLSGIAYSNGQFGFTISGVAGPNYSILTSTNLTSWFLLRQLASPAMPFPFTDTNASNSAATYYRVQLGP